MHVLRGAVELNENITQFNRHPAIELLSDERDCCVGVILCDLKERSLVLVHTEAMVLATGGSRRLHPQGFATSNYYGAAADGLVMAYRVGARLRDVDSFQYHPTGVAHSPHLVGVLISEAVRPTGTKLVNGLGERFVGELQSRDVIAIAILRECREDRGVMCGGQAGVPLDTPRLTVSDPNALNRLVTLGHVAHKCGIDPAVGPVTIHPTLHYQNSGVETNDDGTTCVESPYCIGRVANGIHSYSYLMGNALLDIISFGRRAGKAAANCDLPLKEVRGGVGRARDLQREMTHANLTSDIKVSVLYPDYGKFGLREHAGSQEQQS